MKPRIVRLPPPLKYQVAKILLVTVCTAMAGVAHGQDVLWLREIIPGYVPDVHDQGITDMQPVFHADKNGGTILIPVRRTTAGGGQCIARYRFDWRFWDPVEYMNIGQAVWAEINATMLHTDCQEEGMHARLTGESGTSDGFRQKYMRDITGIKVTDETWTTAGSNTQRMFYQLETTGIASSFASLKLQFESAATGEDDTFQFEIVYVFQLLHIGGATSALPAEGSDAPTGHKPDPFDGSDVPHFVQKEWLEQLEVDSWAFFSGPRGSLHREELPKAISFKRNDTKHVYWEMTLRSPSPSPGADVQVECAYHDTAGDILAQERFTMAFPKGTDSLEFWGEFASNNQEAWPPGSYSMEVLLDGRTIGQKEFEVRH